MTARREITVTFERIGRGFRGRVETFELPDDDRLADELAEAIYRFAKGKLGSKWYDVEVSLDEGRGSIEAGRFGRFTFAAIPT